MSFAVYVPCNCLKNKQINTPPFIAKLHVRNGILDIKPDYSSDTALEKSYDLWKFCEHDMIALEFSMSQSVIGWKSYLKKKYEHKYPNLDLFLPSHDEYVSSEYDKKKAIEEIEDLKTREEEKFHHRLDQFISLLESAIALNQEIYWL
ncbi:hypothetical protein [Lewinella sp. LCG006]|uniref:hypothetical protein n=1 Tax=Lewinella sp. LCG006 TaxID=3231911 RepID=UPI003460522E